MSDLDKVLAHIDADLGNALDRLFQTIRMKSISTDPAYAAETRANAEWQSADLASIGIAHKIRAAFRQFAKDRIPADCRVEFTEIGSGRAVTFEVTAPAFQNTQKALSDEWGKEAAFFGGGGSIPVTTMIKEKLGMDVGMAGFGLSDDRIHSPNEIYSPTSFRKGSRSWARVLAAL